MKLLNACFAVLLSGCASEIVRSAAELSALGEQGRPLRVRESVAPRLPTGRAPIVAAGSRWQRVGRIAKGDVLRPVGQVYSIVGANAHEAYLVVAGDQVVGFYLPGERAFAPAQDAVRFSTE